MKKKGTYLFIFLFIFMFNGCIMAFSASEEDEKSQHVNQQEEFLGVQINALLPTSELKENYDVYIEGGNYPFFNEFLNDSFLKENLAIYQAARQYTTKLSSTLNVIFKRNSGCYGGIGFYLKHTDGTYEFINEAYIELNLEYENSPEELIPIFAHELGHVLTAALIPTVDQVSATATKIHGATVLTDYHTAFHEGFGEHFEVIARDYEKNEAILRKHTECLKRITQKSKSMNQVKRDFELPLRLNYYRNLSPFFMSNLDEYKRYHLITTQSAPYETGSKTYWNLKKTILYRDMGLSFTNQLRPLARNLSTESVMASFFRELVTHLSGTLEEKYTKIFNCMAHQMKNPDIPEINSFVQGYLETYPEDKNDVLEAYQISTGYEYVSEIIPEIWCVNPSGGSITVFDQYKQLPAPVMTFNLNTCYLEDLRAMKIPNQEAQCILEARSYQGFFSNIEEIKGIKGVSTKTYHLLYEASSKQVLNEALSKYQIFGFELMKHLDVVTILRENMLHLFYNSNILFILFIGVYGMLSYVFKLATPKKWTFILKQYFKWLAFVLLGLIGTLVGSALTIDQLVLSPLSVFSVFVACLVGVESIYILFKRKNRSAIKPHLLSTALMVGLIFYSTL